MSKITIELWQDDIFVAELDNPVDMLDYDMENITDVIFIENDEYERSIKWEKENGWSEAV